MWEKRFKFWFLSGRRWRIELPRTRHKPRRKDQKMARWRLVGISIAVMVLVVVGGQVQAGVYNVNLDGSTIDLTGFIEIDAVGDFSPPDFGALVTDYSITASGNGSFPFVFTGANSQWGGGIFGTYVTIAVSPDAITLSAPTGGVFGVFGSGSVFLIANATTNGARENLHLYQTTLGYRTPNPPDELIFETVESPFPLASARSPGVVPEPTALAIWGTLSGLGMIVARRRMRSRVAPASTLQE